MRYLAKHIFDAKELLQLDVIATLEMEVTRRQFVISVADVLVLRKATDDLPWDFLLQLLKRLDPASRDMTNECLRMAVTTRVKSLGKARHAFAGKLDERSRHALLRLPFRGAAWPKDISKFSSQMPPAFVPIQQTPTMMSTDDDSPSTFVGNMDLEATEPQHTFSKGQEVRVRADTNPGMKGAHAIAFVGRVAALNADGSYDVTNFMAARQSGPGGKGLRVEAWRLCELPRDGVHELLTRGGQPSSQFKRQVSSLPPPLSLISLT